MAEANPRGGAPRIHGELLKLGVDVCQATVAKYMVRRRRPPSQTWRTFLANHAGQIVAADFIVVPTAIGRLLFVLVMLGHERRRLVHVAVTDHPTAAWAGQQASSCRNARRINRAPSQAPICRNTVLFASCATDRNRPTHRNWHSPRSRLDGRVQIPEPTDFLAGTGVPLRGNCAQRQSEAGGAGRRARVPRGRWRESVSPAVVPSRLAVPLRVRSP